MQRRPLQLSDPLRIAPELAWQTVDGEVIVVDLPRRRMVGLSDTGSFIWARIGRATEGEIAAELASAFDADEAQAHADVSAFVALLRERGFVVES